MPLFAWEARTSADEFRSGELAAADEVQAIELLRRRGLRVTRVDRSGRRALGKASAAIAAPALLAALRRLLAFRTAGLGAAEALELSARDSDPTIAQTLHAAQLAVESGLELGEALAQHPGTVGPLAARALAGADARGAVEPTLAALVELLARDVAARDVLRRCLVRLGRALVMLLGVTALASTAVLPAAANLLTHVGLPVTAALARALQLAPWLSLGTAFVALALALTSVGVCFSSPFRARVVALVPGLAPALQRLALARFARALAVLVIAEVPRQAALELAGAAADDLELAEAAGRARSGLAEGGDLGGALAFAGFPPALARAVEASERTGELPATLCRLADLGEDEALAELSARTGRIAHVLGAMSVAIAAVTALVVALPLLRT